MTKQIVSLLLCIIPAGWDKVPADPKWDLLVIIRNATAAMPVFAEHRAACGGGALCVVAPGSHHLPSLDITGDNHDNN